MKWNSWCENHTTAMRIGDSQCIIGNLWDFPTQHKVLYVLDAHQHWISQWCCCNDIGVSPMSQENYGHPPTTIDSQIPHNKMMYHYFLQKNPILGSHCFHCTPFSENSFPHNISDKSMHGSHFLNYKYPCSIIKDGNLTSQGMSGCHCHVCILLRIINMMQKPPSWKVLWRI